MAQSALLEWTAAGLYCRRGDFYIDPIRPVAKALITHAHSDHARPGMGLYIAHSDTLPLLRLRLGEHIRVAGLTYGERRSIHGVNVSFHPAGHIIGSAQIRVSYKGEVWVASGDYHNAPTTYCDPIEIVPCHTFITESTFGVPGFKWPSEEELIKDLVLWIENNKQLGLASVLICYALGKAQRLIHSLSAHYAKIFVHSSIQAVQDCLNRSGHIQPPTTAIDGGMREPLLQQQIIVAPPGIMKGSWLHGLPAHRTAFLTGWSQMKNHRMRFRTDALFPMSDHADFQGLNDVCNATGASSILVCHGYTKEFAMHLRQEGKQAATLAPEYSPTLF